MKLAFCLFKYFPYGGLQRDFLRIAKACVARGHQVDVYTMHWDGPAEPGLNVHLIKVSAWQNHTRALAFAKKVKLHVEAGRYDLVVGFNKMPNLDLYYAADVCYQARVQASHSWIYRLSPRYRHLCHLESAVFEQGRLTEIILISGLQLSEYQGCYRTEASRLHLLPPGIARDRIAPSNANEIRQRVRSELGRNNDQFLLMAVGSGFKTKGLDRSLLGIAALPENIRKNCHLYVIGQDNAANFIDLAKTLNIQNQVHFLGGRPDVPDLLLAGDLLVHPAYHENTGTVLLEALVAGLPVLTVDRCGYAHYVTEAAGGVVLDSPFQQDRFNQTLEKMILSSERQTWQQNGLAFAQKADIYSLPEKAADLIDFVGQKRATLSA